MTRRECFRKLVLGEAGESRERILRRTDDHHFFHQAHIRVSSRAATFNRNFRGDSLGGQLSRRSDAGQLVRPLSVALKGPSTVLSLLCSHFNHTGGHTDSHGASHGSSEKRVCVSREAHVYAKRWDKALTFIHVTLERWYTRFNPSARARYRKKIFYYHTSNYQKLLITTCTILLRKY